MQLFYSPTSPYARKCRVLVREFGLLDSVVEVDANPFEDGAGLLRANPLGRVPCLAMEDGHALTESCLIAAWLNAQAKTPWASSWDDRRIEALGSGLLDLAVARRVEMVRETALFSDYWIGRRERGILRALDEMEAEAPMLKTSQSLGALTIAIALDYLDFRFPESQWRKGRAGLEQLHRDWAERDSFKTTAPPLS